MRRTLVVVMDAADWRRRFGHLPPHPLRQFDGSGLYDKKTGDYCGTQRMELCRPYVIHDAPDHIAPDGRIANGRAGKREAIKRSDGTLTDWEPVSKMHRGLANRKFAERMGAMKKGGLLHFDEKSAAWMGGELAKTSEGMADPSSPKLMRETKVRHKRKISAAERNDIVSVLDKHGITA